MPKFHFKCVRSDKPADQVPDIECVGPKARGETMAGSYKEAFQAAVNRCIVPGIWVVSIWKDGWRWPEQTVNIERRPSS